VTMISHGVEISITRGGEEMVCVLSLDWFFFFFLLFFTFFIYDIFLLRYKKSYGVLAIAKTKPKSQNKQTKEMSITVQLQEGRYRSLAHMRARKSRK